jgi:hypothetical protein
MDLLGLLRSFFDFVEAHSAALQALAGCVGLPGLILSLFFLWQQTREQTVATRASIYQNFTTMMIDIDRYFVEHPQFKPYFYGGAEITPAHPDYARVVTIAEMLMDFMDFVLIHKPHLKNYPWHKWEKYFKFIYDSSPVLRKYFVENPDWYGKDLGYIFEPDAFPAPDPSRTERWLRIISRR